MTRLLARATRLLLVLLCGPSAFAAPYVKSLDFTIHEEYVSTRALGMGNAFTAAVDDMSAIFYDPAQLAFRTDNQLRLYLRGGWDPNALKLRGQLAAVKNESSDQQTQGYVDLLNQHEGDAFFFRAPTLGLMWVSPHWGFAFIPADPSIDIEDHRQLGPMLNVNAYVDSTLALSYSHKLKWFGEGSDLSWGTTLKAVHRVFVGQAYSAGDLVNGQNILSLDNAEEGLTFDADLATYWKPHSDFIFFRKLRPTFAIVGRNLIDYGFKTNFHVISKQSTAPPNLGRRVDFGSKFELPKFWVFDPHLAADIRDVGDANWSLRKGSHVGAELGWKMYNWWKGFWSVGLNQGYFTAGFGARFAFFQLDLATYGEEVGTDSDPHQDRRYMLELALDF